MNLPLVIAGFLGTTAVVAGAFGAHALDAHFPMQRLAAWDTAAEYQLVHAVVLVSLSFSGRLRSSLVLRWSYLSFIFGILLFSVSLYALVLSDTPALAMITPFGGLLLILGWLLLIYEASNG